MPKELTYGSGYRRTVCGLKTTKLSLNQCLFQRGDFVQADHGRRHQSCAFPIGQNNIKRRAVHLPSHTSQHDIEVTRVD
jgi:hypothetical protein